MSKSMFFRKGGGGGGSWFIVHYIIKPSCGFGCHFELPKARRTN